MSSRDERWEALYDELGAALALFGNNGPSGDGDFWLIDDDWGRQHHKICVTNPKFWSHHVQDIIRAILARSFSDWGVFVVFEDGSGRPGFIVYEDGVEMEPNRRWP